MPEKIHRETYSRRILSTVFSHGLSATLADVLHEVMSNEPEWWEEIEQIIRNAENPELTSKYRTEHIQRMFQNTVHEACRRIART